MMFMPWITSLDFSSKKKELRTLPLRALAILLEYGEDSASAVPSVIATRTCYYETTLLRHTNLNGFLHTELSSSTNKR